MSTLWSIFFTFWEYLPWVAIALMAGFAWSRRKDSKLLMLQAAGSAAFFVLGIAQWVVNHLLIWMGASPTIFTASVTIFGFLAFVSLVMFATGYCLEKLRKSDSRGLSVEATPVDNK